MADIASDINSWSTTAASNQPGGSTSLGSGLDDNLRQIQATVRNYLAYYNGTPIASSGTTNIGAASGLFIDVSGTTTITAFDSVTAGIWKVVRFTGALTLTHNATSLILPGGANITTANGDVGIFYSLGSGNWQCAAYKPASGRTVVKTVLDSQFQILDDGDSTKKYAFAASPITTGTTRTGYAGDEDHLIGAHWDTPHYSLAASVASNALTIQLKTNAGTDPSATDPLIFKFRNSSASAGTYSTLSITSATSLVVSSGSTLGTVSAAPHRIYVVLVNDNGTARLGVWNPLSGTSLLGLDESVAYSSTAEGGAGAADSAQTLYTGTAVTSQPIRIIGYIESTQTTAGTWASAPSAVVLTMPGARKTGDIVQRQRNTTGEVATGTTLTPIDDTIPQNTEGTQFMSQAITPVSGVNLLRISHNGNYAASTSVLRVILAFFRDSTADAIAAAQFVSAATNDGGTIPFEHTLQAGSTTATTFKLRAGPNSAATITFNGTGGTRMLGGSFASHMTVEEIWV